MQHPDPHSLLTLIKVCAFATANSCEIRCFISSFRACMSEGLDVGFDAPLKKDMVVWLYGKKLWMRLEETAKIDESRRDGQDDAHRASLLSLDRAGGLLPPNFGRAGHVPRDFGRRAQGR